MSYCDGCKYAKGEYSSFPPRYGKVTLPEVDWENIRCPDCGELLVLDHENDYESVKVCPHCNSKALFIKRIRE